jgi:cullin-associated NEDD8-dissociated protein 1
MRVVLGQVGAFSVLKELVIVLPDSLSDHVGSLVPGIERALNVSAGHSMELSSWLT